MADSRRIIDMYIDVPNGARRDKNSTSAQWIQPADQQLYRGTQALFRCHLMLSDAATYFAPGAGTQWLFGIDSVFTADHADLITSLNASFVAADWTSADFVNGKVCWRADFTTDALKTALGDSQTLAAYACLWMLPLGGEYTLLCQWKVTLNNIAVDPTTATSSPGITFATTDMLAQYQKQHADAASVAFDNGQHIFIRCAADGMWVPVVCNKVDGSYVFAPGPAQATVTP